MRQTAMNAVFELAKRDPRVLFIGSDLGSGTLDAMKKEMPDRFFMEGVSEAHVIGMAAGLAMNGYIPYINTIATFLTRRCLEQIAIDLCLHDLPVRLLASGGGVVYAPLGPTHMAVDDIGLLRTLPRMTIVAPSDADEMQRAMDASLTCPGPVYVRIAKGGDPVVSRAENGFEIGRPILMREPGDTLIISTGVMTARALHAAELLADRGIDAGVLHVHTIKPLDVDAIVRTADRAMLLVTIEEHSLVNGLGSAIAEVVADRNLRKPLLRLGLPDAFSSLYGSQDDVLNAAGLLAPQLAESISAAVERVRVPL
jgi:transketolase